MNNIDKVAFILWFDNNVVTADNVEHVREKSKEFEEHWIPHKLDVHSGDCTQMPWTCMRCYMENLYETAELVYKGLLESE